MLKTFCKLIKSIRFYVFIVSAFFMVQAVTLNNQYKTEYNRIVSEYTQHREEGTEYKFTCKDGSKWTVRPLSTIYKAEMESIMKAQLGENFIYDTRIKASRTTFWVIIPFIISFFMCLNILLSQKPSLVLNLYRGIGILILVAIFAFVAYNFVSCTSTFMKAFNNDHGFSCEEEKERREQIRQYEENHKDDWNGYKGTRRNSWAEDEKLRQDGYDPKEYRKKHGYKYYD